MSWPTNVNPFGDNRTPALIGLSSVDGRTIVPIAVDPATGAVITEGGSAATSQNVTAYQGTAPWSISGTVSIGAGGSGVTTVYQGGAPWSVNGTVTIGAGGSGVTTVYQGGAPWIVNASVMGQIPVTASLVGTVNVLAASTVTVAQGTNPWTVNGTVTIGAGGSGVTTVYQGGAPWLVSATIGVPNVVASIIAPVTVATLSAVNLTPMAVGGWNPSVLNVIGSLTTVSTNAGKFGGYTLTNFNSYPVNFELFDVAATATLGVNSPYWQIVLPAATTAMGIAANIEFTNGIKINNGIQVAAVSQYNTASVVATGISGTVLYI